MQYESLSKHKHLKGRYHLESTYNSENSMLCIVPILDANCTFSEIKKNATLGDLLAFLPKSSEGNVSIFFPNLPFSVFLLQALSLLSKWISFSLRCIATWKPTHYKS